MAGVLAFFLLGCEPITPWPEASPDDFEGERIAVSPALIDFGEVSATLQGELRRELSITNLGGEEVTVTGHDEPIGDADVFRLEASPILTLAAGETRVVEVVFTPGTERSASAHLRFQPGEEAVRLLGEGRAPVLETEAASVPATVVGCTGTALVPVRNAGSEPLELSATVSGEDYAVVGWPPELLAGQAGVVELSFSPGADGQRGGQLTLTSNDPLRPVEVVTLEALAYEGASVRESFRYAPTRTTDVLYAVQGGVFAGDPRVEAAAEAYALRLHDSAVDVQVASVASGAACPDARPYYSEPGDSALRLATILGQGFEEPAGRWDDDLLGLVEAALAEAEPGGCLDGWRRDGAALDLVLVGLTPPATDVLAQADALASALPDGVPLRISVLAPLGGECGDAGAYADLPSRFGGVGGEVCQESWVAGFEGFADFPAAAVEMRYPLAEAPVAGSLEVEADGVPLEGWSWDEATNSVVVPVVAAPTFGAGLDIRYVSAVSCEG
jgi:hypothetical protein